MHISPGIRRRMHVRSGHASACIRHEAELSAFGARRWKAHVLLGLRHRLLVEEVGESRPAVLWPIRAPVLATGMPRSGTTILHRLILQDRGMVAPRLFQRVCPWPSRNRRAAALRKTRASMQPDLFRMIAPGMRTLHPLAVDAPEDLREHRLVVCGLDSCTLRALFARRLRTVGIATQEEAEARPGSLC